MKSTITCSAFIFVIEKCILWPRSSTRTMFLYSILLQKKNLDLGTKDCLIFLVGMYVHSRSTM